MNIKDKPRVKFNEDGMFYESGFYEDPTLNELFGGMWLMGTLSKSQYVRWCELMTVTNLRVVNQFNNGVIIK